MSYKHYKGIEFEKCYSSPRACDTIDYRKGPKILGS